MSPLNSSFCKKCPILNYEQLFSAVFSTFHGQFEKKNCPWKIEKNELKSCIIHRKVLKKMKKNWEEFFWVKNCGVFLGLAVWVSVHRGSLRGSFNSLLGHLGYFRPSAQIFPNIYLGVGFEFGLQRIWDLTFVCP